MFWCDLDLELLEVKRISQKLEKNIFSFMGFGLYTCDKNYVSRTVDQIDEKHEISHLFEKVERRYLSIINTLKDQIEDLEGKLSSQQKHFEKSISLLKEKRQDSAKDKEVKISESDSKRLKRKLD